MKGRIFDIQRFALHDGPGIRSVAFLKGCPLHCSWCCNPESVSPGPVLMYHRESCIGCLSCSNCCPQKAIVADRGTIRIDRQRCTVCGVCAEHCPSESLRLAGKEIDSNELIALLVRDEPYFRSSGGGVTLSGGEPMLQPDFATEVLTGLHDRGVHTCMETTGFASEGSYERVVRSTDLFLVDYKLSDPVRHALHTGRDNAPVHRTLKVLARLQAEVVLRAIIIPGINDNETHFRTLARLQREMPNISGIDIMVFHHYGSRKYADLGLPIPELYIPTNETDTPTIEGWISSIRSAGGKNVKRG